MEIIGAIIIGLIVGAIASLLVPGRTPLGCIGVPLVGIGGGILGRFLFEAIFGSDSDELNWLGSFIVALAGAVVILYIFRLLSRS
ncbi:MAG: GlsB/YeaQ/YmgE family stress response membrane protein [Dehalococcoidia bacterium]|nr:GlsB/YeaQ/YmgE family stress response membrane protein [Dehalococcoidia bacterium]